VDAEASTKPDIKQRRWPALLLKLWQASAKSPADAPASGPAPSGALTAKADKKGTGTTDCGLAVHMAVG
jgi:hypothetical protein